MPSRTDLLPPDHTPKNWLWLNWLVITLVTLAIIAVAGVALFIVKTQGVSQGLITLTVISVVVGMVVSMLTLMVNFFQWRASATPEAAHSDSLASLLRAHLTASSTPAPSPHQTMTPITGTLASGNQMRRVDWGEAPTIERFFGRESVLATLQQWIIKDRCRIVAIQGIGGVGKTILSTVLGQQISQEFDYVFWRTLQNVPSLESILEQSILLFSGQQCLNLPPTLDAQILLLLEHLRQKRCLLVLDNFESILQSGNRAGSYQDEYQGFGRLLELIGATNHQSCLLITTREKPRELARMEGEEFPVRSLLLPGIEQPEAQQMLKGKELVGSDQAWKQFTELYSGNPLALKLVSESIRELFLGDIAAFLAQREVVIGDLQELLDQHFERLSASEQNILYWLAIEREATSLETLRADILPPTPKGELLESLKSLRRRSMIESSEAASFFLQPAIMEYVADRFSQQIFQEISEQRIELLQSHTLIKAQAKDYIRNSQIRLLLLPLIEHLRAHFQEEGSRQKLDALLSQLRAHRPARPGYAAGNILNLLLQSGVSLRGYDFSRLIVRQAYLQDATLSDVNFSSADLATCVFTETFGNILSVALEPDGRLLAAGTADGNIELWELPEGTPFLSLSGNLEWIRSIAFSPDGKTLASGGDDQSIRLWDVRAGQCLRTLNGHYGRIYCIAFHPDGSMLASSGDDQAIRLWNVADGVCTKSLQKHSARVRSIAFSPDGKTLASASEDQTINLWEIEDGRHLTTLNGHSDRIYALAFHPAGTLIASGGDDQTVRLWDLTSRQCSSVLHGHSGRVQAVSFSRDGQFLASGSEDQTVRLWDVATGQCLKVLQEHSNRVRALAFCAHQMLIASGGDDCTIRLWDAMTGQCLKVLQGHSSWIYSVAFFPDGSRVVSDNGDFTLLCWDANSGQRLKTLQGHSSWIYSVAVNPAGTLLASGGDDQSIRLWHADTGQSFKTLSGHSGRIRAVAFSPIENTLVSGGDDQCLRIWSTHTGQCLLKIQGHEDRVRTVAFSHDGTLIASSGDEGTIHIWQARTGHCLHSLHGPIGRTWSVAFNSDSTLLASGGDDQTIWIWEVCSGQHIATLEGHLGRIYSVAFSNGALLASGSEDQSIRLWDVEAARALMILSGHSGRVRSVAFSPDSQMLASGSHDGTAKLWNIQKAECIYTLRGDRPYERMHIAEVEGITIGQKAMLKALGATDHEKDLS